MTNTPDSQPREAGFFTTIRQWGITRGDNGFLGGVVDGLANRVGMATGPARIIVVVAAIFLNGIVLLAYAAGWALLPDRKGNIIIQNFGRGVPNVGALIGIGIIGLLGVGGLDNGVTYHINDFPFDGGPWRAFAIIFAVLVPVAIVGGITWLIIALVRREGQAGPAGRTDSSGSAPVYAAMPGEAPHQRREAKESAPASSAPDASASAPASSPTDTSASAAPASSTYVYAPAPPAPARVPRVPGPGKGFYLATLAWMMLSAAGTAYAARTDALAVHPPVAWFVLFVAGLGVLLILVSLSGRTLGFLGFVGIMSVLPLIGIIASADNLRESYANNESIITIDFATETDAMPEPEFDATEVFAETYPLVVLNGACFEETFVPTSPLSSARVSALDIDDSMSIDVTAEVTHVSVPAGTSLTVRGVGDAQAHVVWPERNITCDFYDAGGEHLRLAADTPTLELVVYDDDFANTIVVTEVSS